jgi:hypothetical protein
MVKAFHGAIWGHQVLPVWRKRSSVRAASASAPDSENAAAVLRELVGDCGTFASGLAGLAGRHRSTFVPACSRVGGDRGRDGTA